MGDIFPPASGDWRRLECRAAAVAESYGFEEIRTPLLEPVELFARGLGESSDIVQKEMFVFADAGGKKLALRPEGTAGVARAFIEKKIRVSASPLKYYYLGTMFRRERPQAGRRRQFHQFGTETLGTPHPAADAEAVDLLTFFLSSAGVAEYDLALNSVGCRECRPAFQRALAAFFRQRSDALCPHCRRRLTLNVLRILDCKNPVCRKEASGAPLITEHLCAGCETHFSRVRAFLDLLPISYRLEPRLVRGLDYYTRTVFEAFSPALGAQDAVAAGGRYDNLVESLDGEPSPAVGFSAGLERVLLAASLPTGYLIPPEGGVYLAGRGDEAFRQNFILLSALRRAGVRAEIDFAGRSLKAQMRSADRFSARRVVIRGEDEIGRKAVRIKDLETGSEKEIPAAAALSVLTGEPAEK